MYEELSGFELGTKNVMINIVCSYLFSNLIIIFQYPFLVSEYLFCDSPSFISRHIFSFLPFLEITHVFNIWVFTSESNTLKYNHQSIWSKFTHVSFPGFMTPKHICWEVQSAEVSEH
jgi:hypothetical protein